jgi:phosphoribosylanthranilate isomerase
MYLTKIKLSRITNLSDARYAAAAGFDFISFCFKQDHERFISPALAKQMIGWLSHIECVGEFENESAEDINEIAELTGLSMVQLAAGYEASDISRISYPVILECHLIPDQLPENVVALQIEVSGIREWKNLQPVFSKHKIIVHPLFDDLSQLRSLIEELPPFGLSLSGGDEQVTGMRDFDEISELLEKLEA